MSRTAKHSKKHGPLAHGKGLRQRAVGYEWGNTRLGASAGWVEPGPFTKKKTHRKERREGKKEAKP